MSQCFSILLHRQRQSLFTLIAVWEAFHNYSSPGKTCNNMNSDHKCGSTSSGTSGRSFHNKDCLLRIFLEAAGREAFRVLGRHLGREQFKYKFKKTNMFDVHVHKEWQVDLYVTRAACHAENCWLDLQQGSQRFLAADISRVWNQLIAGLNCHTYACGPQICDSTVFVQPGREGEMILELFVTLRFLNVSLNEFIPGVVRIFQHAIQAWITLATGPISIS